MDIKKKIFKRIIFCSYNILFKTVLKTKMWDNTAFYENYTQCFFFFKNWGSINWVYFHLSKILHEHFVLIIRFVYAGRIVVSICGRWPPFVLPKQLLFNNINIFLSLCIISNLNNYNLIASINATWSRPTSVKKIIKSVL